MTVTNPSHLPSTWQVSMPAVSPWPELVHQYPILRILEQAILELEPMATEDFWAALDVCEEILVGTFHGQRRPVPGTPHDRAWHHLFVLLDDLADRKKVA